MADIAESSQASLAVILAPDAFLFVQRKLIMDLANRYRLPTIYQIRDYAVNGGLCSYGVDPFAQIHDAAGYVSRILRGDKPGDLPVQEPTKFYLAINQKVAKAFGLTVPPTPRHRRRCYGIGCKFAAAHMAGSGPVRSTWSVIPTSAFGGEPEKICSV